MTFRNSKYQKEIENRNLINWNGVIEMAQYIDLVRNKATKNPIMIQPKYPFERENSKQTIKIQ
jgi:hypothetical protein